MKFSKLFCVMSVFTSLLVSSIAHADTCYDPNYDRYYDCGGGGDEYIAPVIAGLLFGAILANQNDDGGRRHHHRDHGDRHGGWERHH